MANAFPFFRLPRELRDLIYSEIGGREVRFNLVITSRDEDIPQTATEAATYKYAACIKAAPTTNMLLTTRAIKDEYTSEVRRHMELVISQVTGSDSLRQYNLPEDEKLRACLEQIPLLSMSLIFSPYDVSETDDEVEAEAAARGVLIRTMTCVRSFDLDMHSTSKPELEVGETGDELKQIYHALLSTNHIDVPGEQERRIEFHGRLFLHQRMYSLLPTWEPSEAEREKYPLLLTHTNGDEIRTILEWHSDNKVVYQVTLSSDPEALMGLAYNSIWAGKFDLEEHAAYFEKKLRSLRARFEHASSEEEDEDEYESREGEAEQEAEEDYEEDDEYEDEGDDEYEDVESGAEADEEDSEISRSEEEVEDESE